MMGSASQIYPDWIKNLIGTDVPDFRGVVTAVFDGLICSLNPYPKTWKFRNQRALAGWDVRMSRRDDHDVTVTVYLAARLTRSRSRSTKAFTRPCWGPMKTEIHSTPKP